MKKTIFVAAAIIVAGLLGSTFESMHVFGVIDKAPMDDHYLVHAPTGRSAQNVVTSIVFDYRGFDTIGEAAVLFTAVSAIGALFRDGSKKS